MDDRTKRIVELVRSGLSSEEIVRVFETEKVLNVMDAVNASVFPESKQLGLPAPEMKPKPARVRLEHKEEALHEVCMELISDEEWVTAPVNSAWELPVARLANATKGMKGESRANGFRSLPRVCGSVSAHFRDRYGKGSYSVQREDDRVISVTKVR